MRCRRPVLLLDLSAIYMIVHFASERGGSDIDEGAGGSNDDTHYGASEKDQMEEGGNQVALA